MGTLDLQDCQTCASLTLAALEASKFYHGVLADLEAAHISRDADAAVRINAQAFDALQRRDDALAELASHQRTHSQDQRAQSAAR